MPKVSIIVPFYNVEGYIEKCLDTLVNQTLKDIEIILVNDGSTDRSIEIVNKFLRRYPEKLVYLEKENGGLSDARNYAIPYAKGEYIAFLDSDDLWYKEKLQSQIAFMQENGYAFTCTSYEKINEGGESLGKVIKSVPKADYNRVLLDCPVGNSTVVYDCEKL